MDRLDRSEHPETASLYAGVPAFDGPSGRHERGIRPYQSAPENPQPDDGEIHVVQDGDRIDVLAFRLLGDSRRWPLLADLNRLAIPDPQRLQIGAEIFVPASSKVG